jgi:hypothetical protein
MFQHFPANDTVIGPRGNLDVLQVSVDALVEPPVCIEEFTRYVHTCHVNVRRKLNIRSEP